MKKFLVAVTILAVLIITVQVKAADISTTFGWQQDGIADVASWNIYRSSSASGPWTLLKNQVKYTLSGGATEYQTTAGVTVADNALTTVYFKANTVGTNGLVSVDSNVISKTYDTRTAPSAPTNFNVK